MEGGGEGALSPMETDGEGVHGPAGQSSMGPYGSARVQGAGDALRVLVVDDNRDAAEMLGMSLEQLGHQVIVVFSADGALEQAQGASVALVDLAMPGVDGFELAQRLRRSAPELRLIAVTGFGDEHNRAAAGRAGFDRYLVKPVKLLELDAILRQRRPGESADR